MLFSLYIKSNEPTTPLFSVFLFFYICIYVCVYICYIYVYVYTHIQT